MRYFKISGATAAVRAVEEAIRAASRAVTMRCISGADSSVCVRNTVLSCVLNKAQQRVHLLSTNTDMQCAQCVSITSGLRGRPAVPLMLDGPGAH